jgi:hypothetical protein
VNILNQAVGQLIALIAFFAFPASQYVLLKTLSLKEGQPELWYLPDHGFRLVIRNLPRKKILTDIRTHAFVRQLIAASEGSSVVSIVEETLVARDDMVLFPGIDQILLRFRLYLDDTGIRDGYVVLAQGGSPDAGQSHVKVGASDSLVCDYSATIQNFFNFDVQMGKRVEIGGVALFGMLVQIQRSNVEQRFPLERILNFQ